ncbi:septum formation initiator family protein [Ferruginibacter sp. HRS2-29]|jgi:cell division protein DivIC|uniref:FtsB family cell division protein n=1 Tax=Ferruginibacter sp. HRS2-29 TaxID=2487334 RepID=UPI0020CED6FF|nr:septum formation initiator family protein [Ferruginibacter sp. HRS2-29]MCP9752752.1 septum formation initiator family protein [Ferruginibacter sp. HRS2-29]
MKQFSGILSILKNKYFIASAFFIVWMLFFDPKDWGLIRARENKLVELNESEEHLTKMIKDTRTELGLLKNSAQTIEKYSRENFYMKKDNEDLFIVKTP